MQVRLLGPVDIANHGAPEAIGQPTSRILLAVLALSPNRVVPVAALIDAMWQDEPSRQRERNVHAQVYQLRRRLAELEPGRSSTRLVTRMPGYQLELAEDELDVSAFTDLARRGRDATRSGDLQGAAALLGQALALWRGPALADAAGLSPRLAAAAAALDEQHLTVLEDHADAELAMGRHAERADALTSLVGQYPLRERMRGQLMLALYRSGRQDEALECYRRARREMADELGLEPGPQLRHLYERIAAADPGLQLGQRPGPAGQAAPGSSDPGPAAPDPAQRSASRAPVPRQLPASVPHFAGRQAELDRLDGLLDQAAPGGTVAITAIAGTAGIGKSALALHWAHRVADRFPDGQLHVNLRGYDPAGKPLRPADAIRGFLDALGVPPEQIPQDPDAQTAMYRTLLAGRRMLLVLDNAHDAAQVRPLLPASPASLVIVTSRSPLTGLITTDGAIPIRLDVVSGEEAAELLAARLGSDRVLAEPGATAQLVALCARLPLALAITAARAAIQPALALASLAAQMAAEQDRLDALDTGEDVTSVRAVLSWSYGQLSPPAARMFRLLGLHGGPDITVAAAASLAAVTRTEARRLLGELLSASLISEHVQGRYSFHDLLRTYAGQQAAEAETQADRDAAVIRALDHYLYSSLHAALALAPTPINPVQAVPAAAGCLPEQVDGWRAAMAWFEAEHAVLIAAVHQAFAAGLDDRASALPLTLEPFLVARCLFPDLLAVCEAGIGAASRSGDNRQLALLLSVLGYGMRDVGKTQEAVSRGTQAVTHAELAAEPDVEAEAHMRLAASLRTAGQIKDARLHADEAAAMFSRTGNRSGQGLAASIRSHVYWGLGDYHRCRELGQQAVDIFTELGNRVLIAQTTANLGTAHEALGDYAAAMACYQSAHEMFLQLDALRIDHAYCLLNLGDVHAALGDVAAARDTWQRGLDILGDQHHPATAKYHARLALAEAAPGILGLRPADPAGAADAETGARTDETGPDQAAITAVTEEFLHQQATFETAVVAREDWLLGALGVQQVRLLLYRLLAESSRQAQAAEQWQAVTHPPAPAGGRDGVLTAMQAAVEAFRLAAAQVYAELGLPWPAEPDTPAPGHQHGELRWT